MNFSLLSRSVKRGDYVEYGWPEDKKYLAYIASKIGVSALSRIQQRQFDQDPKQDRICNHVTPGAVATDIFFFFMSLQGIHFWFPNWEGQGELNSFFY